MIKKLTYTLAMVILLLLSLVLILPHLLGFRTFAVLSGSMSPVLRTGSLAYVKNSDPKEIAKGDIITYYTANRTNLVTHRVIAIDKIEKTVITKGDANENRDGLVGFDRIVGKMIYSIPKLGYLTVYVKTKAGFMFSVGTLITIMMFILITEVFTKESKS